MFDFLRKKKPLVEKQEAEESGSGSTPTITDVAMKVSETTTPVIRSVIVIDDNENHLRTAQQQFADLELKTASTYDEGYCLLDRRYHKDRDDLITKYKAAGMNHVDACERASRETMLPYWDLVCVDLLLPASSRTQVEEGKRLAGQEMPLGWALALQAAQNGAKYVLMLTDVSHHRHPASAALDEINYHVFNVDGAQILFDQSNFTGIQGTERVCLGCSGSGKQFDRKCWQCEGTGNNYQKKGKDWKEGLEKLFYLVRQQEKKERNLS